jgi:acetyltransferase-like isoleucine patch superfamily enzyme
MNTTETFRSWVKRSDDPMATAVRVLRNAVHSVEIPAPQAVYIPLSWMFFAGRKVVRWTLRQFLWTPMFKARIETCGRHLFLYGGFPMVTGPVHIHVGNDCRISGQTTMSGRWSGVSVPELKIGSNVDIGWRSTLAIGRRIVIGNNVRIAERAFLAGYPGHPLNAEARAAGLPDTEEQCGDIILEDDVWLASGVTVLPGITIGQGTVVAAGSVVTRCLPSGVVAAGVPARVVRKIEPTLLEAAE